MELRRQFQLRGWTLAGGGSTSHLIQRRCQARAACAHVYEVIHVSITVICADSSSISIAESIAWLTLSLRSCQASNCNSLVAKIASLHSTLERRTLMSRAEGVDS